MPPHFKRAVIHGVGLLGGSLGLSMRRRRMAEEVVGLGRSMKRLERARQLGSVDTITTDLAEALNGADALILCTPPRSIRKSFGDIAPLAAEGMFITDVGSVKESIVGSAEKNLRGDVLFIGSHPMAGSEKSGVEAARGDLFENSPCFVTPTETTPSAALNLAVQFWKALDCRIVIVDPVRHDDLMASISHLPHLLAVTLVQALYRYGDSTPYLKSVIGNGFRDSTRIAAGPAEVWEQIFTENSAAMIRHLDALIENLHQWRDLISRSDSGAEIVKILDEVSRHRQDLAGDTGAAGTATPQ